MKTGVAIALAIGIPATIGIVAWAIMANKIVDAGTGKPTPPKPTPDPVSPPPQSDPSKLPAPPAPVTFRDSPDGASQAIVISNARALKTWATTELHRQRIGGNKPASEALGKLLAVIPHDRNKPIVAVLFEEVGGDEEWSDIKAGIANMSVATALSEAEAGLKDVGL